MKFTIEKPVLLNLIEKVSPILNSDKMLKANTQIQFEVFNNGVMLSTFSTEANIKAFQPLEVGETLLPFGVDGKILQDLLKALPDGDVSFTLKDGNVLKIASGKKSTNLKITSAENFPLAPNYKNFSFIEAPGLFTKIDSVSFCALTDANDHRAFLKCVFMNEQDVVATNGFRLALNKHGLDIKGNFLMPVDTLSRIGKTFKDTKNESVAIAFDNESNYMHFKIGECVASIRTVAKDYVRYQAIIPTTPYDEATMKKDDLQKAIDLVSVLSDKMHSIKMDFDNTSLKVHVDNQDLGEVEDTIEISYNRVLNIGIDSSYLEDVLKRISGDTITLELRGELLPVIARDKDYVHVIMPKKRAN